MKCNLPEEKQEKVSGTFGMNLYDLNKQIIASTPAMSEIVLEEEFDRTIVPFIADSHSAFYMLLCNDLRYYTIFQVLQDSTHQSIMYELHDCLINFCDEIKAIHLTEAEDAVEIWFVKDGEVYVMYFFDYSKGVIQCGQ